MLANMDAVLVLRFKEFVDDIHVSETVIWRVPFPVEGSTHGYKYRLYFGRPGQRIIGFDNERGKGDHKHVDDRQTPYRFVDVPSLLRDFDQEVRQWLERQVER